MKLISVVLLLAGLACSTSVSNDDEGYGLLADPRRRGYRRQRSSCGKVALIRQDNKRRSTRCMGHLEKKVEQQFNVEVVRGLERSARETDNIPSASFNQCLSTDECMNGSTCVINNRDDNQYCDCSTAVAMGNDGSSSSLFAGKYCEFQATAFCRGSHFCVNGGECSSSEGWCRCPTGLRGRHCEYVYPITEEEEEEGGDRPLLTVRVNEDTRCAELTKAVLGDIKREVEEKYNERRARACLRKPVPGYLRTSASTTSTKRSKASTTGRSKKSRKSCGAPEYIDSGYPSCQEVLQGGHVNSYYDNPSFLCKTEQRPCAADCVRDHIKLPDSMVLNVRWCRDYSGGAAEVWVVRTDRNGIRKTWPWNSEYRFFSEGRWFSDSDEGAIGEDFNNYHFGSLTCGPWDDNNDYLFIIVDGVLVDSCPKSIAQQCRDCDGR